MKRLLTVFAFLLTFGLLATPQAQAQVTFEVGPRLGIDVGDVEELFIGADARISSAGFPLIINPTFDYYFTDDPLTFWSLSANALYPFVADNAAFTPYAGAGIGLYRSSVDDIEVFGQTVEGDSVTDIGLNLIFGAQFLNTGPVSPFAEAQYSSVFSDGDTGNLFSIKGGVLFGF